MPPTHPNNQHQYGTRLNVLKQLHIYANTQIQNTQILCEIQIHCVDKINTNKHYTATT